MIYRLGERHVVLHGEHHFIADNASVIGSVVIHDNVSIWFNVVIRGDEEVIRIGADTNVQDGSVLHADKNVPLTIGKGVTVGHKAMLHGCTIGDYSLIGINAVVLNGAKIGSHCIVGAGALVTEGMEVPDHSLVVGCPAKIIRTLDASTDELLIFQAQHYVINGKRFSKELVPDERFET